jgi:hypothetical protein
MNPKPTCFVACTLLGALLAVASFAAIVIEPPPDALLLQASRAVATA